MKEIILAVITIIVLFFGFIFLFTVEANTVEGCIASGHAEDFCHYGVGPRY